MAGQVTKLADIARELGFKSLAPTWKFCIAECVYRSRVGHGDRSILGVCWLVRLDTMVDAGFCEIFISKKKKQNKTRWRVMEEDAWCLPLVSAQVYMDMHSHVHRPPHIYMCTHTCAHTQTWHTYNKQIFLCSTYAANGVFHCGPVT